MLEPASSPLYFSDWPSSDGAGQFGFGDLPSTQECNQRTFDILEFFMEEPGVRWSMLKSLPYAWNQKLAYVSDAAPA
jgi:hypothetical protein